MFLSTLSKELAQNKTMEAQEVARQALDQIVAGGQPEGISLLDNLVKEAAEEAAIEETVARTSTFASEIRYCSQTHRGLNNDGIFAYDLWLDETFIPHNTDGEVESFQLMPIEELEHTYNRQHLLPLERPLSPPGISQLYACSSACPVSLWV